MGRTTDLPRMSLSACWKRASLLSAAAWLLGGPAGAGVPRADAQEETAAGSIRLAVACAPDVPAGAAIQDAVAAALSHEARVEVLDRAQVDLVLREGSLNALSQDATRRTRLGRLLALDYLVNLRRAADDGASPWVLEAVNAQTGALAGSVTVSAAPGPELERAATRFVQATLLGKTVVKPDGVGSRRVAVLDFTLAEDVRSVHAAAVGLRLSAEMRGDLNQLGDVLVLDRSLCQQVAREHQYLNAGLAAPPDARLPMLGADCLVAGELRHASGGGALELALTALDTKEGRPLGARSFPLAEGDAAPLPDAARAWLGSLLHVGRAGTKRTYQSSIQVEALEPFYRGIAQFQAGRYLEATGEFQRAYILNDKFGDAMLWEARCYDALGLQPLANGERRFVANELVGHGYASTGVSRPEEAVTFLGLTGNADAVDRAAENKIEMLAIDLLSGAGGGPRLQLASHLARFRDEYDALVGTPDASGLRWSDAPGFLTGISLYGEILPPDARDRRQISWQVVDTLSGQVRARAETLLDATPAGWSDALRPALTALWKPYAPAPGAEASPAPRLPADLPDVRELAAQVASREGIAANMSILGLLLRDPGSPLLLTHHLSKGGGGQNLEGFLQFAVRDDLLARLSANAPARPWLELERIDKFLPCDGTGPELSGDYTLDAHAELARFAAAHPDDAVGCLAEYQVLYDQLGSLDPADLADRLGRLETRLARYGEDDFFQYQLLPAMARALRVTAQIATGKHPELSLPTDIYAHVLHVRFGDKRFTTRDSGKPGIDQVRGWRTMEWGDTPESVRDPVQEARASLAILGRGDARERVPARWLRDYPDSGVITAFAISSLHEANWSRGRPILYEFDAAAERSHYRDLVAYCYRNLCERVDGARTAHELRYWERWVHDFTRSLCDWGYLDTVPDAEFEAMRAALAERVRSSGERYGVAKSYRRSSLEIDWRQFVRRPAAPVSSFESLWGPPATFYDRDALLARIAEAGPRSWRYSPLTNRTWTEEVHDWRLTETITDTELAALYLPYLPRLAECFPGPDLSFKEMAFLFDFGYTLMCGGKLAEAEEVFARILDVPEGDLNRFASARELRANAALAQCLVSRASNRKAEALGFAQQALTLTEERPFRILGRLNADRSNLQPGHDPDSGDGRALALRLSDELRGDAQTAGLPPQVRATVVRTPDLANAEVTYYYRVPASYRPGQGQPCPLLVLVPSLNQDALDYCLDTNAWARWADEQGIFLVVPKFLQAYNWGTGSEFTAEFHDVQVWSGQATLQAVENIRAAGYRVATERLLLHGFGGGSQFVDRFARWAPERCAALSLHSAGRWTWCDWTPGLKSLACLRGVPCLATTGERDATRRDAAVQWVTLARGAGLPVTWKELPGVGHYPTPEMEEMSRAFLAGHAHDAPPPAPAAVAQTQPAAR